MPETPVRIREPLLQALRGHVNPSAMHTSEAQQAEQRIPNPTDAGSNPAGRAINKWTVAQG